MPEFIELKEIVTNFISDFLFWIFLGIISILYYLFRKFIYPNFQKVKIRRIDIRNVPKFFQGRVLPTFQSSDVYRNYIENELVIENKKDDILIKDLVVENIIVQEYKYEDIEVQNGFDMTNQRFDFVAFNNGNKESSSQKYNVKIHYLNKIKNKDKIIFSDTLIQRILKGGDIRKIFSRNLTQHSIIKHFSNNLPDYKQSIKIDLIKDGTDQIVSELEIPYASSSKKFIRNLGGGGPIDRTLTPIIELVKPYNESQFIFTINHKLSKGINKLRFNILVDGSCRIKYSVKLLGDKNKKISSFTYSDDICIQFPIYHLISPYKDDLYHYLNNERIDSSNFEEVRLRRPSLINSIDKVKQEYNLL